MGKWVSRVGAAGGGKSYQKTRPTNYYALLIVIVALGLLSVVLSRYDYQHPAAATVTSGTPPAVGTTWYAGVNVEVCGVALSPLAANTSTTSGLTMKANNVLQISPLSAADSGSHATLGQFGAEYPGLILNSSEIGIPTAAGTPNPATTYHNGELCPSNSKYPKQAGRVVYAYWPNLSSSKPVLTTNPSSIKLTQYLRVTLAFDPQNVTPAAPSKTTVNAMVVDQASVGTTTTTAPVTTTTTGTTTTTAPPTTTTTTGTTTTTAPVTTTTTAKG
jgi:hypothetical protein